MVYPFQTLFIEAGLDFSFTRQCKYVRSKQTFCLGMILLPPVNWRLLNLPLFLFQTVVLIILKTAAVFCLVLLICSIRSNPEPGRNGLPFVVGDGNTNCF